MASPRRRRHSIQDPVLRATLVAFFVKWLSSIPPAGVNAMIIRKLAASAAWLGMLQLLNYALPVVTLPVIARAFGPTIFGTLATLTALSGYIGLLASYGSNLSGPRWVVNLRHDPVELSATVSAMVGAQLLMGALGVMIYVAARSVSNFRPEYRLVAVLIVIQVCANSISPQWIFLGLDRIRDFVVIQMAVRVALTAFIFISIHTPADVLLYAGANCAAGITIAAISTLVLQRAGVRWRVPPFAAVYSTAREAGLLFLSTVSISLYTSTNVIIVNLVLGPGAAGSYALAERLYAATVGVMGPILSALYPFVCRIAGRDETHQESWTKQLFFCSIVALSGVMSLTLFLLAPTIISLVGGTRFESASLVLRIMAFAPVLVALSNIFATQTMIPLGMDRQASWIFAAAAALSISGMFILTNSIGLIGAPINLVAVEAFVTLSAVMILRQRLHVLSLFWKSS
jgi:polysaccharide transporter, PST family